VPQQLRQQSLTVNSNRLDHLRGSLLPGAEEALDSAYFNVGIRGL
jgi:hypothetical protein